MKLCAAILKQRGWWITRRLISGWRSLGIMDAPQMAGMYIERGFYNFKQTVQNWFRELLELLFQAAALIIDTLRTFFLVVLSILGPIAFAISVYDGFHATLTQWITRYISVYLWLPVSDLFSSILARIQVLMLQKDIEQLSDPNFIPDGQQQRVCSIHDYRHRRVFHYPNGGQLDYSGRWPG